MNQMLGIFGEVLFIIGVLMTIAGAGFRLYLREKEHYRGRVMATVVEVVADVPDEEGCRRGIHDYFYPVFAFYANGRLMKERYWQGSNPARFHVGQKIAVKYDIHAPYRFELVSANSKEKIERFLYFGGLLMILAGGVCYFLFALRVFGV